MRHASLVGVFQLLFALLAVPFAPARLCAQSESARESPPAYREHIAKALQEFSLGHWSEARVYFAEAHALWPNARTFRGLGMACYEARDYAEAIDFLEQALQNAIQPLTPKLAAESRDILQQAKRFVANVRIDVVPENAIITIDDKALVRRADGGTMLNPGEHQLDISADGFQDLHRSFMAEAGQALRIHHKLTPLGTSALPSLGEPGSGVAPTAVPFGETTAPAQMVQKLTLANQQPVVAAIVGGVGFAVVTAGWVFYMLRNDIRLELWERGLESQAMDGAVAYEQSSLQSFQTRGGVAIAGVVGGSLLLSLAQYFWLPDSPSVPAWAWVSGAVGLAIGLTGLGFALFENHCEVTDPFHYCQRASSDAIFAPLIALHAIPFISVPIMYLARPRQFEEVPEVALSVTWFADAGLGIRGTF